MAIENIKALVAVSIEVSLMRIGGPQYHTFVSHLGRDHGIEIADCYDNPEALKSTLKEVYGEKYPKIVNDIEVETSGQIDDHDLKGFFQILKAE